MLGRYCKIPTTLHMYHMELVNQVLMYVAWTRDMGLGYSVKQQFTVFSDSD
jgi:type 1 glutamine amidotransferase